MFLLRFKIILKANHYLIFYCNYLILICTECGIIYGTKYDHDRTDEMLARLNHELQGCECGTEIQIQIRRCTGNITPILIS